jgi:hypothetical protein
MTTDPAFDFIALGGGLRRIVEAEQRAVAAGQSPPCPNVCDDGCHSALVCIRAGHPHDPDVDMGEGRPRGNVVPHVGLDRDGQLVQWTCLPGDHDGLDDAARVQARADADARAKVEATHDLLETIDPALLVDLLRQGGHL